VVRRRTRIDCDAVSLRRIADTAAAEVEAGAVDEILAVESESHLPQHSIGGCIASGGWQRRHQDCGGQKDQQERRQS
jgi:hypothetical protein